MRSSLHILNYAFMILVCLLIIKSGASGYLIKSFLLIEVYEVKNVEHIITFIHSIIIPTKTVKKLGALVGKVILTQYGN